MLECIVEAKHKSIAPEETLMIHNRETALSLVKESVAKAQQAVYDAAVRVIREDLEVEGTVRLLK